MSTRFYDTDLTDAAWAWVAPVLPAARPDGRPRVTNLRAILNAIFYLLGVTTRKGQNCPAREAAASSRVQQFELEHDFQGAPDAADVAVHRKALFRDRNQKNEA